MSLVELSQNSKSEFEKEVNEIAHSLHECADQFALEEAEEFFRHFVDKTLRNSSFEEDEYLNFARDLVQKLKNEINNERVIKLLINLSRIDGDLSSIYSEAGVNLAVAHAIRQSPDYFTTPFNEVMIFDYLYSHYYWKAQDVFRIDGFNALTNYLRIEVMGKTTKSEEILTSILSSFMSVHLKNNKSALKEILNLFGDIKPIEKKALRLLSLL